MSRTTTLKAAIRAMLSDDFENLPHNPAVMRVEGGYYYGSAMNGDRVVIARENLGDDELALAESGDLDELDAAAELLAVELQASAAED